MDAAIRERIEEGDVRALALDTNIFERYRFSFDDKRGMLDKVARVKDCGVRLVMPDVVLSELDAHLRAKASESAQALHAAAGKAQRLGALTTREQGQLAKFDENFVDAAAERASKRLHNWIGKVGIEVVEADDYIQLSDLTRCYFSGDPPFNEAGPKKHEFPDAIALLTLDAWAEEQNAAVLAVSDDNDWVRFGAASKNVIVTKDLAGALGIFQQPNAENASRALFGSIANGDTYGLENLLREALNHQGAIDVLVDADSQFEVRNAEGYPTFTDITFPEPEDDGDGFEPVSFEEGTAVVRVRATATAEIECFLSFAKWDNSDNEYMSMGSAKEEEVEDVEIEALVTLTGKIPADMTIEHVDVQPQTVHIRIADAEPDWMRSPEAGEHS